MSREIKFRAWFVESGTMYSWEELINKIGFSASTFVETELWKPMQHTGLNDWYAGDIIQKGEIIRAITVDWEHGMRFMLGKHILCKQDGINGTKIGNIHNNPKLLEPPK